jgi:hypothetical protein
MTRADYMSGKITFAEYYREIARIAGISWRNHHFLPNVKAALASGDEHLNSISLATWDVIGTYSRGAIARAKREMGDAGGVSMADIVCVHKQAAIDAVNYYRACPKFGTDTA